MINSPFLEVEASNGIIILVKPIHPIRDTHEVTLMGSLQARDAGGLENLSDQKISEVKAAASEVGKVLEGKGFEVNY